MIKLKQNKSKTMKDTLDIQQQNFNLGTNDQKNAKYAMKNLYKLQLDEVMNEKTKIKERQKEQANHEKVQFAQKAIQNQQEERAKEKAYKNYYEMISKSQESQKSSFISPFSVGDSMKNNHIKYSIEEGYAKIQKAEQQEKERQMAMKNKYKEELLSQIEEKRKYDMMRRQEKKKSQEEYQRYGKLPTELSKFERQRHREEMVKYREDLDKIRSAKDSYNRSKSQRHLYKVPEGQHHLLINPLPYNIQNPYILKQMHQETYQKNEVINQFNRPPIH